MKQRFIAGLIIILPLAITVWVISFLVHLCTKPFGDTAVALLVQFKLFQSGWWIFSHEQVLSAASTLSILCGMLIFLFIIGFISHWLFFHVVIKAIDRMVLRVPIVNKVYRACREVTDVLFTSKSASFSKVVWAPFPTQNQSAVGLVTNEVRLPTQGGERQTFTSVLIPGTPNPTVGFLIMCPKEKLTQTSLGIDSAMKWVISCGSSETEPVMLSTHDLSKLQLK
jgi:uncharacterized membrane protein